MYRLRGLPRRSNSPTVSAVSSGTRILHCNLRCQCSFSQEGQQVSKLWHSVNDKSFTSTFIQLCLSHLEMNKPKLRHYLTWVGRTASPIPFPIQLVAIRLPSSHTPAIYHQLPQLPPLPGTQRPCSVPLLTVLPAHTSQELSLPSISKFQPHLPYEFAFNTLHSAFTFSKVNLPGQGFLPAPLLWARNSLRAEK